LACLPCGRARCPELPLVGTLQWWSREPLCLFILCSLLQSLSLFSSANGSQRTFDCIAAAVLLFKTLFANRILSTFNVNRTLMFYVSPHGFKLYRCSAPFLLVVCAISCPYSDSTSCVLNALGSGIGRKDTAAVAIAVVHRCLTHVAQIPGAFHCNADLPQPLSAQCFVPSCRRVRTPMLRPLR